MLRELTLNVEETLYNTLMPMVEKQTIENLLAEFVQTIFLITRLRRSVP